MRIIVFILVALIQAAVAAVIFFMLVMGLNGFSEADATPSLFFFIALGILSALGLGGGGAFMARRLVEKKSLGGVAASALAVLVFSILGVVILIGGFFVALVIASIMHDMK